MLGVVFFPNKIRNIVVKKVHKWGKVQHNVFFSTAAHNGLRYRTYQYITNPSKICTISIASSKSSIKFSLICTQKSTFMTLYTTVLRSPQSLMN